jgi:hypothetical protein
MSISLDPILDTFISIAREALDGQLSTIGSPGNPLPAVIKERQTGPKPFYPYATINILDITENGEWLLQDYVDDDGNLIYENNKYLFMNYRVYGGNALEIANNLYGYFRIETVLDSIREDTGGALVQLFDIDSLPTLLPDTFLETASFNFVFGITDTLIIPDTGTNYISSVGLDGELHNGLTDPPPLDINVNAP